MGILNRLAMRGLIKAQGDRRRTASSIVDKRYPESSRSGSGVSGQLHKEEMSRKYWRLACRIAERARREG